MVMTICLELGKDEKEVANWTVKDLTRWMGFLHLKNRLEKEALDRSTNDSVPQAKPGMRIIRE